MATMSKDRTTRHEVGEGFEGRWGALDGYTVGFESYSADVDGDDLAALFRGLPDDRCQCPHWGVVLSGRVGFRYADGTEETIEAGQAYYAPPGHTPVFYEGTSLVEFSPTEEFDRTLEVVVANMAAMAS